MTNLPVLLTLYKKPLVSLAIIGNVGLFSLIGYALYSSSDPSPSQEPNSNVPPPRREPSASASNTALVDDKKERALEQLLNLQDLKTDHPEIEKNPSEVTPPEIADTPIIQVKAEPSTPVVAAFTTLPFIADPLSADPKKLSPHVDSLFAIPQKAEVIGSQAIHGNGDNKLEVVMPKAFVEVEAPAEIVKTEQTEQDPPIELSAAPKVPSKPSTASVSSESLVTITVKPTLKNEPTAKPKNKLFFTSDIPVPKANPTKRKSKKVVVVVEDAVSEKRMPAKNIIVTNGLPSKPKPDLSIFQSTAVIGKAEVSANNETIAPSTEAPQEPFLEISVVGEDTLEIAATAPNSESLSAMPSSNNSGALVNTAPSLKVVPKERTRIRPRGPRVESGRYFTGGDSIARSLSFLKEAPAESSRVTLAKKELALTKIVDSARPLSAVLSEQRLSQINGHFRKGISKLLRITPNRKPLFPSANNSELLACFLNFTKNHNLFVKDSWNFKDVQLDLKAISARSGYQDNTIFFFVFDKAEAESDTIVNQIEHISSAHKKSQEIVTGENTPNRKCFVMCNSECDLQWSTIVMIRASMKRQPQRNRGINLSSILAGAYRSKSEIKPSIQDNDDMLQLNDSLFRMFQSVPSNSLQMASVSANNLSLEDISEAKNLFSRAENLPLVFPQQQKFDQVNEQFINVLSKVLKTQQVQFSYEEATELNSLLLLTKQQNIFNQSEWNFLDQDLEIKAVLGTTKPEDFLFIIFVEQPEVAEQKSRGIWFGSGANFKDSSKIILRVTMKKRKVVKQPPIVQKRAARKEEPKAVPVKNQEAAEQPLVRKQESQPQPYISLLKEVEEFMKRGSKFRLPNTCLNRLGPRFRFGNADKAESKVPIFDSCFKKVLNDLDERPANVSFSMNNKGRGKLEVGNDVLVYFAPTSSTLRLEDASKVSRDLSIISKSNQVSSGWMTSSFSLSKEQLHGLGLPKAQAATILIALNYARILNLQQQQNRQYPNIHEDFDPTQARDPSAGTLAISSPYSFENTTFSLFAKNIIEKIQSNQSLGRFKSFAPSRKFNPHRPPLFTPSNRGKKYSNN